MVRRFPFWFLADSSVVRVLVILVALIVGSSLMVSCSEKSRYRVLSFFFDGVAEPGKPVTKGYAPRQGREKPAGAYVPTTVANAAPVIAHAPYRDNRCGDCHNRTTGRTVKSIEDGLCVLCHSYPQREASYVHGPVAVQACTACHHPHGTGYAKLLLDDPGEICFRCHIQEDLTSGPHHATITDQGCVDCHDPHGGSNRFFLKRTGL